MVVLTTAVVVLAVLGLANLALTLAIIKRLQQYRAQQGRQMIDQSGARLQAGTKVPDFSVTTVSGETRSLSDLTGARSAIAFLSVGCAPCRTQLPEFVQFARGISGGVSQVLAVVIGDAERDADTIAEFRAELEECAQVTVEDRRGPAATALSVMGFPTFYVVDADGKVEASGAAMRMVTNALAHRELV